MALERALVFGNVHDLDADRAPVLIACRFVGADLAAELVGRGLLQYAPPVKASNFFSHAADSGLDILGCHVYELTDTGRAALLIGECAS
jgi:hypothetical protein